MEEKVLVKSRINIKGIKILAVSLLIVAVLLTVVLFVLQPSYDVHDPTTKRYYEHTYKHGFEAAAAGDGLCVFLVNSLWFVSALTVVLITVWLATKNEELIITDKNVIARWGIFGISEYVLPLYKISSYGTKWLFSYVSISTPSKKIRFLCIENYDEIADVLSKLINERQEETRIGQGRYTDT